MPTGLRLIVDPPQDGVTNMAADEAMLLAASAAAGDAEASEPAPPVPTLRLYRWSEPTLSLGYFQSFADVAAQAEAVRQLPLVRRPTGGGAIVHADELTYCLALPARTARALAGPDPAALYAWMHAAVAEAVGYLAGRGAADALRQQDVPAGPSGPSAGRDGPFFCFQRRSRFDLMAPGGKVAGSAQRRTRQGVLQHGSVILRRSFPAQPSGSLSELLGRDVAFEEFAPALAAAVRGRGVSLEKAELTGPERAAMGELRAKHASLDWLRRRPRAGHTPPPPGRPAGI